MTSVRSSVGVRATQNDPLVVRHLDKDLIIEFGSLNNEPGTYANLSRRLRVERLLRPPTLGETISVMHAVFIGDPNLGNPEFDGLRELLIRNRTGLWCYTGVLFKKNDGAYIQDHPDIVNGVPYMYPKYLEERVKDGELKFVPHEVKEGALYPEEITKNLFIQALVGQEGAKKLAELAAVREFESKSLAISAGYPVVSLLKHIGLTRDENTRPSYGATTIVPCLGFDYGPTKGEPFYETRVTDPLKPWSPDKKVVKNENWGTDNHLVILGLTGTEDKGVTCAFGIQE